MDRMRKNILIFIVIIAVIIGLFIVVRNDIVNGIKLSFRSLEYKTLEDGKQLTLGVDLINNSNFDINLKDVQLSLFSPNGELITSTSKSLLKVASGKIRIVYFRLTDVNFDSIYINDLINLKTAGYYIVIDAIAYNKKIQIKTELNEN